jgi:hypothetical protein
LSKCRSKWVVRPISGWTMAAAIDGVIEKMNFMASLLVLKIFIRLTEQTQETRSARPKQRDIVSRSTYVNNPYIGDP